MSLSLRYLVRRFVLCLLLSLESALWDRLISLVTFRRSLRICSLSSSILLLLKSLNCHLKMEINDSDYTILLRHILYSLFMLLEFITGVASTSINMANIETRKTWIRKNFTFNIMFVLCSTAKYNFLLRYVILI